MGGGDLLRHDQLAGRVHLHVAFVFISCDNGFSRSSEPPGLLPELFRLFFPIGRSLARFDGGVFLPRVALFGHGHKSRVHQRAGLPVFVIRPFASSRSWKS
jgi:hypothetical protein